jgi:hypothetical protein
MFLYIIMKEAVAFLRNPEYLSLRSNACNPFVAFDHYLRLTALWRQHLVHICTGAFALTPLASDYRHNAVISTIPVLTSINNRGRTLPMIRRVVFWVVAVALVLSYASAQYEEPKQTAPVFSPLPFVGQSSAIPPGYSLRISLAAPPFASDNIYPNGSVSAGIDGLVAVSYNHEGAIGSPVGKLFPANLLGFRVQVVPQREQYPAVSLFISAMTQLQEEKLANIDLQPAVPVYYDLGLKMVSYEAKTTRAGIGLNSTLGDVVNLDFSLGVRENVWRQMWSFYTVDLGFGSLWDPLTGATQPLQQQSKLALDWSASIAYRPVTQLAILASATTLPFADIDPTTLTIQMRQGNMGTVGVRYYLPFSMSVDLFDRWYLAPSTWPTKHEICLGVSADLAIR